MKCPNRITIIVAGVVGAAALACFLLLPKKEQPAPKPDATEPTRNNLQIQTPTDSTVPPVIITPGNEDSTDPTGTVVSPDTQPNDPVVKDSNTEEQIKDIPQTDVAPEDSVVDIGKPEDAIPDPEQGEIRNDAILQEKEENAPKDENPREDVIVPEDDRVTTGEPKEETSENKPDHEDDGEGNKNNADSETPAGGDNPFDDDTETDVEDTPVEDLVGDDEERPGDGIHF